MPLNIVNRDNVTDNATLELDGATSVATAVVAGVTYLFVAGLTDDGVSVFAVGDDGALTNVANVTDNATLELDGATSVTTSVIGGTTYLFVAGGVDDGVSVFAVGAGGALSNVVNVTDNATLELDGARSVTTAVIGGTTYLFVAGQADNGVSVFEVNAAGGLLNVANVTDDPTLHLGFVSSVTTAVVGGSTFLFAAGLDGLSVFFVDTDGSLTNVFNVADNASLALLAANSLATAEINSVTYLFASSFPDGGVSVFAVDILGQLTNVDNVFDSPARVLRGASSVSTAVVDGVTYLFVTGSSDSGVSVFAVGDDGVLSQVTSVTDVFDPTLAFQAPSSTTTAVVGGTPYLFVTGETDDGVSVFELASDDTLIGTNAADTLDGQGGDDLIVGLDGDDTLVGGRGEDRLVGGEGDDTLTGGADDDELYGDTGIDTAVFSGNQADYLITALGNGDYQVSDQRAGSPDGTDTLHGIEDLAFADGTISLTGNAAPTDIALSHTTVAENSAAGTLVGVLSATDPNTGDSFTYQLLDDAGGRFRLNGALLEVAGALDFEAAGSHQVTVRVTDSGGLSHDETFTIGVSDVLEGSSSNSRSSGVELINRFNVTDDATLQLAGARSVTTAVVDGVTYLFAAGAADNGISVFAVGADGSLANVSNVSDNLFLDLDGVASLATAVIGGVTYLFAAARDDNSVSAFRVNPGGVLGLASNVADDATLNLNDASSVATAVVGGTTYLFVAGRGDSGVSVFAVDAAGVLTNVDNVADDATLELENPVSVTTAVVGGTTYLFVAGQDDDGVSVFAVAADGTLTNVWNVSDDATLNLRGVFSVTTAAVGGITYLFAAGADDDGVSVFAVGDDGSLINVENVSDNAILNLAGVVSVTTAVVAGVTYLFAAGAFDNGVSVFSVGLNGSLTNVANVSDDATLQLAQTLSVATAAVGGTPYLFAAGFNDNGVSVFELVTDDTLIGTSGPDTLDGHAGDDLIIGLGGNDLLIGGEGDDTILGGDGNDMLAGGAGRDMLFGDSGNDRLDGGTGDDTLSGGAGDDVLDGGAGIDTAMYSGARADYAVSDLGSGRFRVADLRTGSPDGTDTLTGIETLQFSDGSVATADLANRAPTDLDLSHAAVAENSAPGTVVGRLTATDPDVGDTFTYLLTDSAGGRFALNGSNLVVTGPLDFETASAHQVTVRVTDALGLSYDERFTVAVTDVAEANLSAPVVTVPNSNVHASSSQPIALSSLVSASDPDGNAFAYLFYDSTPGGGHFEVNGVTQAANTIFAVVATQLSQVTFVPGNGTSDDLLVGATDDRFSGWSPLHIDGPVNNAPVVTVPNSTVSANPGETLQLASLFGASDPENDAFAFLFYDSTPGGGHFEVNGVAQQDGQIFAVPQAQISQVTFVAGPGTDDLLVGATDGQFSGWSDLHIV